MKLRLLITAISVVATANIVSAAPFAYIVNSTTKKVEIIDTADNTVKTPVNLSDGYPWGVTVGASGQYVYVGVQTPNAINIIDTFTKTATQIGLSQVSPGGLALNAAETRLYVTNNASNTLHVIDLPTMTPVASVAVDTATVSNPAGIVLSAAGDKAYVANSSTGKIAEITISEENGTYERTALTSVASNPVGLTLSSDGSKLYVSSGLGGTASIINTATMAVASSLTVGSGTTNLAATATRVYAPSNAGELYAIDAATGTVLGTPFPLTVAPGLFGSSLTPDGTKLYMTVDATDNTADSVKVVNFADNNAITTIAFPTTNPTGMGNFMGRLFDRTITATGDADCIISPSGSVPVNIYGRKFKIISDTGAPCEVKVDGAAGVTPAYAPSVYAFTNVTANHTISASKVPSGTYFQLSAEWSSNVGGYLVSTPAGISNVSTKAQIRSGDSVTIAPDSNHMILAGSWTGDCLGQGATCTIPSMNGAKNVTAVVVNKPPAGLSGPIAIGPIFYQTLAEAIAAAANNDVIKISSAYTGGCITNGGTAALVTLSGNWNADLSFTAQSGSTSMGALTIGTTGVIADNLTI